MYYWYTDSPVGKLLLEGDGDRLHFIHFDKTPPPIPDSHSIKSKKPFKEVIRQLSAYFSGDLKTFSLDLHIEGTPFQLKVWQALREIPYGRTASYGEIARNVGNPKASRAVGGANHRNPLPIVIPCHRVIGANGRLVGFGGGLDVKEALLTLERDHL
jgi:methylated-DNA-[protein]-cysteine S-methyltransferase